MKAAAGKLALLLISAGVALWMAENVLRRIGFEYRPMTIDIANPADARFFHLFEDDSFIHDPEMIWRPKRSYGVFNEQGFRGPVLAAEKPAGERRVFTVGDSNTLGWAGPDGPNWPAQLGERLRKIDPAVTLVNAGVWGYTSYQGLQRFREVLRYQPDLTLISFGANDAHLVSRSDAQFASTSLLTVRSARKLLRYRTGQLAAAAWDGLAHRGEGLRHRVSSEEYRANLEEIAALGRERAVGLVFLTRPYVGPIADDQVWKSFAHRYNRLTVEVAAEQGLPVVDLYSFFKLQDPYFSDPSHFTEEGHQRAAWLLSVHLRPWARGKALAAASPSPAVSR